MYRGMPTIWHILPQLGCNAATCEQKITILHTVSGKHKYCSTDDSINIPTIYTAHGAFNYRTVMPATRSRNLYQKLAWKIWRKYITVFRTTTAGRPITFHGSCHVLDSFCPGIELCSSVCKKLVHDCLTHVQVSCTRRLPRVSGTRFLSAWLQQET